MNDVTVIEGSNESAPESTILVPSSHVIGDEIELTNAIVSKILGSDFISLTQDDAVHIIRKLESSWATLKESGPSGTKLVRAALNQLKKHSSDSESNRHILHYFIQVLPLLNDFIPLQEQRDCLEVLLLRCPSLISDYYDELKNHFAMLPNFTQALGCLLIHTDHQAASRHIESYTSDTYQKNVNTGLSIDESFDHGFNACPQAEATFANVLSGAAKAILVYVRGELVGVIKLEGESTMLGLQEVYSSEDDSSPCIEPGCIYAIRPEIYQDIYTDHEGSDDIYAALELQELAVCPVREMSKRHLPEYPTIIGDAFSDWTSSKFRIDGPKEGHSSGYKMKELIAHNPGPIRDWLDEKLDCSKELGDVAWKDISREEILTCVLITIADLDRDHDTYLAAIDKVLSKIKERNGANRRIAVLREAIANRWSAHTLLVKLAALVNIPDPAEVDLKMLEGGVGRVQAAVKAQQAIIQEFQVQSHDSYLPHLRAIGLELQKLNTEKVSEDDEVLRVPVHCYFSYSEKHQRSILSLSYSSSEQSTKPDRTIILTFNTDPYSTDRVSFVRLLEVLKKVNPLIPMEQLLGENPPKETFGLSLDFPLTKRDGVLVPTAGFCKEFSNLQLHLSFAEEAGINS